MKKSVNLLLAAVLILQFGCGPKVSEIIKNHEDAYQKRREQFIAIAKLLPPVGNLGETASPCRELNPPILFDQRTGQYNTEMVMSEQLSDPGAKPAYDFILHGELLVAMHWTDPKNTSHSDLEENRENVERILKAALEYRYLVVNRVRSLQRPEVKNENSYVQGQVTTETFVVDMTANKVICGFVTSAKSMPDISSVSLTRDSKRTVKTGKFSKKEVVDKAEPVIVQQQKAASSSLFENGRLEIINQLKQRTGAAIELD